MEIDDYNIEAYLEKVNPEFRLPDNAQEWNKRSRYFGLARSGNEIKINEKPYKSFEIDGTLDTHVIEHDLKQKASTYKIATIFKWWRFKK